MNASELLNALEGWQSLELRRRTVLVVGGDPARIRASLQHRQQTGAIPLAIYPDTQAQASQALDLTGSPVLIGVRAGQLEWSIVGVLNDPSVLAPVVKNWIEVLTASRHLVT